ncbi:MAG: PIN domain-containing protein [Verrucomicrobia bacterium]|nr:PIN domain-containing protein [Verrucomicrobiota bacterium]
MKAVDTNVLARFLVNDDPRHGAVVRAMIVAAERSRTPLGVSMQVLLELSWLLLNVYRRPREQVVDAVAGLVTCPAFSFERPGLVAEFIQRARRETMDLADILIGLCARDSGYETVLTFDKVAARSDLFEALPDRTPS